MPDFANGHSAGVGVLLSADFEIHDTSSNQINGSGSAFYEADMRGIERTFADGYTEFFAPRSGMTAVPYIGPSIPFYTKGEPTGQEATNRLNFHLIWGKNNTSNSNYFHLLGCRGNDFVWTGSTTGITDTNNNYSFVYEETIEGLGENEGYSPEQIKLVTQAVALHEIAHQFLLNRCADLTCGENEHLGHHDSRPWWNFTTTGCPNANPCLMDWQGGNLVDGINRFCKEDLFLGDPNCSNPTAKLDSAIRTISDPIP